MERKEVAMSFAPNGQVGRAVTVGLLALLLAGGAWAAEAPGATSGAKPVSRRIGAVPPAMAEKLRQMVPMAFSETPIADVRDFLQQVTGLNMILLPPLGAGAGWMRSGECEVTINASGTLAEDLDAICAYAKLCWRADADAIILGPRARLLEPRPRMGAIPEEWGAELAKAVPPVFCDTPVYEAADFLTKVTGRPFVVLDDDKARLVTLASSTDMAHGLDAMCEYAGLAWGVVDGKLTIGTWTGLRKLIPPAQPTGPALALAKEVGAMPEPYRSAAAFPTDEDVANTRKALVGDEELRDLGASLSQVISRDLLRDKSLQVVKEVAATWEDESGVTQFARYRLMATDRWLVQVREGRGQVYVGVRRAGEEAGSVPDAAQAVLAAGLAPRPAQAVELKPVSNEEKQAGLIGSTGSYGDAGPLPKAERDATPPPDGRVSLWTDGRIVIFQVTRGPQPVPAPEAAPSPIPDLFR
jgi:hypothetical protein